MAILGPQIIPVTAQTAADVAQAYTVWGKGQNPAGLNFGDCFAYVTAKAFDCPLCFIGQDFIKTDIISALPYP